MTIDVLLFARVAELLGASQITLSLPDPVRASDVLRAVRSRPHGDQIPPSTRVAVDHRFVDDGFVLTPQCEVALIPPVAGG